MNTQILLNELNAIFWNRNLNDYDTANILLDKMDQNKSVIQFDKALKSAYRLLNIWSRTEKETGTFLDEFKETLNLKELEI